MFFKITLTKIIMPIFTNKNNIYLLQITPIKVSIMHIFLCTNNILYLYQNNTKKKILGFVLS